ncbi:PLAT domain-containing protein 3-like [Papaver somniferum]|uniref:PLAT domain-containing protein 3-like n=1 Tax=Papaver somniferum TaxID=3469 RepID=UPI000E6F8C2B|nr:PLAT domain-containing protein 3-like [Papaver somniferum]
MAFVAKSLSLVLFVSLLFSFAALTQQSSIQQNVRILQSSDDCVYIVYTKTGTKLGAGTDSGISLALYDSYGDYIIIQNLKKWGGIMGQKHNYFENGDLDVFSNLGGCLKGPVCKMTLTSDGKGSGSDWYVEDLQVTTTGPQIPCAQKVFTIEQWLALDTSPYKLSVTKNLCNNKTSSVSL